MRERYPVVTTPPKGGGFCPDFVVNNKTDIVPCNTLPCSESDLCYVALTCMYSTYAQSPYE